MNKYKGMGKGSNPNSRKNLIPFDVRSVEEARENGKKGGTKSGEVRRSGKFFRELDQETTSEEEKIKMWQTLKKKAMQGDLKAFEIYRDTIGEKPTENMNISTPDQPVIIITGGEDIPE